MNATLLLRLAAPLQSWGYDSKFERRTTGREPTKSGAIGMVAAALGRGRDDSIDDLAALKFGVRIDQPGQMLRDFHTAEHKPKAPPYVTLRFYLMDAVFLAGFEGDAKFLEVLEAAINSPVFPLFLGRRSCPPEGRMVLGIREKHLQAALSEESWQAGEWYQKLAKEGERRLTLVLDGDDGGDMLRRDVPVSFSQKHRRYSYRYINDKAGAVTINVNKVTRHDAFEQI